ncbi:hypothetical protein J132_08314 [Termitomyces sp. J132]|nr:hypothetical protein J132_08314 [Termitomyces sp. J132]
MRQNEDKAAQSKEHGSKMDKVVPIAEFTVPNEAGAAAAMFSRFAIADNSAPISNPSASATNSSVPNGSAPIDDSTPISNPGASATDSTIATGSAASDKSAMSTGIATNKPAIPSESDLVTPIAATGQLMDVDTTALAPPFITTGNASDEIAP